MIRYVPLYLHTWFIRSASYCCIVALTSSSPLSPLGMMLVPSQDGYTALIKASAQGHLEVVEALVAAGADVNAA